MKKVLFILVALFTTFSAKAFVFDGINLSNDVLQVTRDVASRGYVYDIEKNCLKGSCQGTEIYLKFNTEETKDKKKIGQLIVEVPMVATAAEAPVALKNATMVFNVIYHQTTPAPANATRYAVDEDGTTLDVTMDGVNMILTYTTPYYKAKK